MVKYPDCVCFLKSIWIIFGYFFTGIDGPAAEAVEKHLEASVELAELHEEKGRCLHLYCTQWEKLISFRNYSYHNLYFHLSQVESTFVLFSTWYESQKWYFPLIVFENCYF